MSSYQPLWRLIVRIMEHNMYFLICLLEEWSATFDQNKIIGAVLLDLSKAFGCIPYNLLIAKLNAYEFDKEALKLIYSYLKRKETICMHQ